MAILGTMTVKCPHCAEDVRVDLDTETYSVLEDNTLHVVVTPRFEHECPEPDDMPVAI